MDKAVFSWFVHYRPQDIPPSEAALQQKVKDIRCLLKCNIFQASSGWLHRFKGHAIVRKMASGKAMPANVPEAAARLEKELPGILMRFEPADIYDADEPGFFHQMLPN